MKLNHDCIRDTMLTVEEYLPIGESTTVELLTNYLKKYDKLEVAYVCKALADANYLDATIEILPNAVVSSSIRSLTFEGHLFLDNIKDDNIWSKSKEVARNTVNSVSIEVLSSIALGFAKGMFGL